ncbi:MAG TPA: hypothetical protein VG935_04010, partial [Patescibacteria group bacterium]|nr:hypothetical protein [Patescibacteria group bacterium]
IRRMRVVSGGKDRKMVISKQRVAMIAHAYPNETNFPIQRAIAGISSERRLYTTELGVLLDQSADWLHEGMTQDEARQVLDEYIDFDSLHTIYLAERKARRDGKKDQEIQALAGTIDHLTVQVANFKDENTELRSSLVRQRRQIAELVEDARRLHTDNTELKGENHSLRNQIRNLMMQRAQPAAPASVAHALQPTIQQTAPTSERRRPDRPSAREERERLAQEIENERIRNILSHFGHPRTQGIIAGVLSHYYHDISDKGVPRLDNLVGERLMAQKAATDGKMPYPQPVDERIEALQTYRDLATLPDRVIDTITRNNRLSPETRALIEHALQLRQHDLFPQLLSALRTVQATFYTNHPELTPPEEN